MSVCAGEASATAEDRHRATHLQREPAQDFRSVLNITNADTVPDLKKHPKWQGRIPTNYSWKCILPI